MIFAKPNSFKPTRIDHLLPALFLLFAPMLLWAQNKNHWYKGNTHTHSLWSDGNDFPEMIMDWYKSNGYDFIALSDHNTFAAGEKWASIPSHPFRQQRFKEYLAKYGKDWVVYKTDSSGKIQVRLKTLAEYRPLFEEKNKFLIIQAEEITDKFESKPIHINAVNLQELILPQGGNSVAQVMQNNLDRVYEQRRRSGEPIIAHINHPNFGWAVKLEDMMQLKGERFFEVYNGHPHVHNYGDSITIGMEELWDRLLIHYIGEGKELLYGLATDDAHDFIDYKIGSSNPGRGWIMVRADTLSAKALIHAMERGDFYSTTGVELDQMDFIHNKIKLALKPERGIDYSIQFWGAYANKRKEIEKPVLLKEVKGSRAAFKIRKKHLYVRAKIVSSKLKDNPFAEGDLDTAWTQPHRRN